MKKIILILFIYFINHSVFATETKKAYFAGGCFWCMEESYDQVDGVLSSISGYSGGHLKNPKYEDVKDLLNVYWKNIDPFDASGQFCDKGKSYRSVIFFENNSQKELIDKSFKEIEKKFDKKIVTLVWKFDIFYPAENYHQDYYEKNFIRYLMYKNACKREETLKKIWN